MDLTSYKLDLILVPLSLFLTACYHAYLWQSYTTKHPITAIELNMRRRMAWLHHIQEDTDKKGILAVQTFRNLLMAAILSATIAITVNSTLAALANNVYNSDRLLRHAVFGAQSGSLLAMKYACASVVLLLSFVCSSMSVGLIIETNFIVNAPEVGSAHAYTVMRRGLVLGVAGNRVMFSAMPLLLWLLSPVALALSSAAMVLVFYSLDFAEDGAREFELTE